MDYMLQNYEFKNEYSIEATLCLLEILDKIIVPLINQVQDNIID